MREWFKRQSGARQTWIVIGGLVAVLFVIAGITGAGDESDRAESSANAAAQQQEAATPKTKTKTTADADTGRMSDGEYQSLVDYASDFDDEWRQFGDSLGKCAAISSAGQLAEASECYDEGYDGVETAAGLAYSTLSDLIEVTAKDCRASVRRLRDAVDRLTTSMQQFHGLTAGLADDVAAINAVGDRMIRDARRFSRRSEIALLYCAPA